MSEMIFDKMHDLRWNAPRHCRIVKWRLTYEEASKLAHELADLNGLGGVQSPADIVGMMKDGTAYMWRVPIELRESA